MEDNLRTTPRDTLVAALRSVPPNAPTVCEGWQARHLAAHVVLRERAPWRIAAGMLRRSDACFDAGEEIQDLAQYEALVDEVAQGPGALSPMSWVPGTNVAEFHIHALDVLRGERLPDSPAEVGPETARALWRSAVGMAKVRFLRSEARGGVGVVLVVPDGARAVVAKGEQSVVVTGTVPELLLVASGRARASLATLSGPDDAVAGFRAAVGWDA